MNGNRWKQAALVVGLALAAVQPQAQTVVVEDLGIEDGYAQAINEQGQVVGRIWTPTGFHAFVWSREGGIQDIHNGLFGTESRSRDINNYGHVVGIYEDTETAFMWTPGPEGGVVSLGNGDARFINDLDQVLISDAGEYHSTVYIATPDNGKVDIGNLGVLGQVHAEVLNEVGLVTGWAKTEYPPGGEHAFLGSQSEEMVDIGTLGAEGRYSAGYSVNDYGVVVGEADLDYSGYHHAILWTLEGGIQDLVEGTNFDGITTYSSAIAINNAGQILGKSTTPDGNDTLLFWSADGTLIELGTPFPDRTLITPFSFLNELGDIVVLWAEGLDWRSFLWTARNPVFQDLCPEAYRCGVTDCNNQGQCVGYGQNYGDSIRAWLWTYEIPPPTPQEQLDELTGELETLVETGSLKPRLGDSLIKSVENVGRLLEAEKLTPATNILGALIKRIEALIGNGTLAESEGMPLIESIENLIDELNA